MTWTAPLLLQEGEFFNSVLSANAQPALIFVSVVCFIMILSASFFESSQEEYKMADHKWIKWVVGLSSVAVFTGLVGLNAGHSSPSGQTAAAATSGSASRSGTGSTLSPSSEQSNRSSGSSTAPAAPGNRQLERGQSQQDSSAAAQPRTQNRMRTHAS